MKRANRLSVSFFVAGITLYPVPGAAVQEEPDSLDLSGEWRFDTEEIVRVTHDGGALRAEFVEGAECLDGQVRPYFLDGALGHLADREHDGLLE
jgi:hypothetical protein